MQPNGHIRQIARGAAAVAISSRPALVADVSASHMVQVYEERHDAGTGTQTLKPSRSPHACERPKNKD